MLKEMGTGLVVTELMGQGVSGITGDYSVVQPVSGLKTGKFNTL